jgi:hypothetical protein
VTRATGNPHGPKPKELTPTFIFGCAKIMCTQEEIGDLCGLSQPQVCARIKDDPELEEAYRRGQATAKQSLRRVQFKNALAGNVVAGIWLSKNHLGMSDRTETHDVHDVNVNVKYIAKWGGSPGELTAASQPNDPNDPDDPDTIDGELVLHSSNGF